MHKKDNVNTARQRIAADAAALSQGFKMLICAFQYTAVAAGPETYVGNMTGKVPLFIMTQPQKDNAGSSTLACSSNQLQSCCYFLLLMHAKAARDLAGTCLCASLQSCTS